MFRVRPEPAAGPSGNGVIDSLSLPHGVECQDQVAQACESLAAPLVEIACLAVRRCGPFETARREMADFRERVCTGWPRRENWAGSRRPPFRPGSRGVRMSRRCGRSAAVGRPPTIFQNVSRDPLLPRMHRARRGQFRQFRVARAIGAFGHVPQKIRQALRIVPVDLLTGDWVRARAVRRRDPHAASANNSRRVVNMFWYSSLHSPTI